MLHSVVGQSYENWRIILIDDVSEGSHKLQNLVTINSFQSLGLIDEKFSYISRTIKRWETYNVLSGIKQCDDGDIICRLDADDYLCDLDALALINEAYEKYKVEALWTAHRWNVSDRNISANMPVDVDPYKFPWVSSHLKTFRKQLINEVAYENFLNQNNELVKRCGDQAIYLPVLRNAGKARGYLPRVTYNYNIDEKGGAVYQTDDAKFQKAEADFLRQRGYVIKGTPWEQMIG